MEVAGSEYRETYRNPESTMHTVLIIDDEQDFCRSVERMLSKAGYAVQSVYTATEGLRGLQSGDIRLVLLDHMLPDINGMDLLPRLLADYPQIPVILMTSAASLGQAVEAAKTGAYDYLEKPFERNRLLLSIRNALVYADTRRERDRYREACADQFEMVGRSDGICRVRTLIEKVAGRDISVLITGESGTGKELVARALHNQSNRSEKPFVRLNCAAIPENLLESEMFGHEKGAFTGAHTSRPGRFFTAHEGTLFLDEIGEMSPGIQAKLLRTLESGEIQRVGSEKPVTCDVRVLTATNKDLRDRVSKNLFREDLYYRLNVVKIHLPPLRERKEDIPLLLEFFITRTAMKEGIIPLRLAPSAVHYLCGYAWPGNVREMEHFVSRMMVLHSGSYVDLQHVREFLGEEAAFRYDNQESGTLRTARDDFERNYIRAALAQAGGNVTRAAENLGIDRRNLYRKMEGLGMDGE
ncbi:MAG TPA: sigma-54-dependent Fis family transcriptional regulator [bacterium]|nr:sigma-54-dependent Fis family transcriptional regulator [bacterium]